MGEMRAKEEGRGGEGEEKQRGEEERGEAFRTLLNHVLVSSQVTRISQQENENAARY